jgi:hypothetical protein
VSGNLWGLVMTRSRSIVSLPCAAFAMAGMAATTGLTPALAIEFTTYELFEGADSVAPKPEVVRHLADAMRKAQAPGNCPLGKLQIRTPEGDELFQKGIAAARRDNVLQALDGQGVKVAGRLFVESTVFGASGGHDTAYQLARDDMPPQLKTESMPRKGSKVKAGATIKVTMTARDDPTPWPTGLKTIQLVADSDHGRFIASENYEPCAEPAERRVVATYMVPDNPPPIVRLTALAEDHARHMDTDVGEFPTGDWYGWITWSETLLNVPSRTPTRYQGRLDFTADYDGRGNLTGKLVATENFEGSETGGDRCDLKSTKPTNLEVSLTGSYTPGTNTMSLFADPRTVKYVFGEVSYSCNSPPHQLGRLDPVIRSELNEIMRNLGLVNGDHAEVIRDWNPASNGIGALHMELNLHRARN